VRDVTPVQFGLAGAAQLGLVIREVTGKGKTTLHRHYMVTSRPAQQLSAQQFLAARREHWGVEGKCHQRLDVSGFEDKLRVRSASAAATLGLLCRISLALFLQWCQQPGRRKRDKTYPVWSGRQIHRPSSLLRRLRQPFAGDG
jgi:predicted transposase YbfD/YdcC